MTAESTALAKGLKRRGFRFVGPTTAYALMQAVGIVNDHLEGCFVRDAVEAERAAAIADVSAADHAARRGVLRRVQHPGPRRSSSRPCTPRSSSRLNGACVEGREEARAWATKDPHGGLEQRLVLEEVVGDPHGAHLRRSLPQAMVVARDRALRPRGRDGRPADLPRRADRSLAAVRATAMRRWRCWVS